MTPKEKAKELFDKYLKYIPEFEYIDGESFDNDSRIDNTKECVIILINEMLDHPGTKRRYLFWKEVKQEIENL